VSSCTWWSTWWIHKEGQHDAPHGDSAWSSYIQVEKLGLITEPRKATRERGNEGGGRREEGGGKGREGASQMNPAFY